MPIVNGVLKLEKGQAGLLEDDMGVDGIEASSCGLKPGDPAPLVIEFDGVTYRRVRTVEQDGDVLGWDYESPDGVMFGLIND